MTTHVLEAHDLDSHRLAITFSTGESAVVDFSGLIASDPGAAPLRDAVEFASFYLDEWPHSVSSTSSPSQRSVSSFPTSANEAHEPLRKHHGQRLRT